MFTLMNGWAPAVLLCGPSVAAADGVIVVPLHVRDERELGAATLGFYSWIQYF